METNNRPNAKAIASLVVSCVSVLNCCLWQLAILCAVVGIVIGIIALREENQRQKDLAVAGIVVGAVGLTLSITLVAVSYTHLSVWHDQRKSLSNHIHCGEELHLPAQFIVIPFFYVRQMFHMGIQICLFDKCRSIYTSQHLIFFISSPVSS